MPTYNQDLSATSGNAPTKQVGLVDPFTGQAMTNVPPAPSNTLGQAKPVFNPQAQQVAQGLYGGVDQRQYGTPFMFKDQNGDGEVTQADVIQARTQGYKK